MLFIPSSSYGVSCSSTDIQKGETVSRIKVKTPPRILNSTVDFKVLMDNFSGCQICPTGFRFDLDAAVSKLFNQKPNHPDLHDLMSKIERQNPGNHTIVSGDHIFLVCKAPINIPLCLGIVDVSIRAFAKGGFGKVYDVQMIDSNVELVLKLSRKNRNRKKIEYNPLKAHERGGAARKDLKKERKMMQFISECAENTRGLNCEVIAYAKFGNQEGIFIKKYDMDGEAYLKTNPDTESCWETMSDLVAGMIMLHNLGIFHRDLKLANTLIRNRQGIECEGVISDFGNACHFKNLFTVYLPYPSLHHVLGSGTKQSTSVLVYNEINLKLNNLKNFYYGTEDYNSIVSEIKKLLEINDCFSMSLVLYRLATRSRPPFQCWPKGDYFQFDGGLTAEQQHKLVDDMSDQIYAGLLIDSEEDAWVATEFIIDHFIKGMKFKGNKPYEKKKIFNPAQTMGALSTEGQAIEAVKTLATIYPLEAKFTDSDQTRKKTCTELQTRLANIDSILGFKR